MSEKEKALEAFQHAREGLPHFCTKCGGELDMENAAGYWTFMRSHVIIKCQQCNQYWKWTHNLDAVDEEWIKTYTNLKLDAY